MATPASATSPPEPNGQETVETVFGKKHPTDANAWEIPPRIPNDAYEALRVTKKVYNLDTDMLKTKYVEMLNNPNVLAQAKKHGMPAWRVANSATRGYYVSTVFGAKAHPFVFQPFSVTTPIGREDKNKGRVYDIRASGYAVSKDPEVSFAGPADFAIFAFASENDAQRRLDGAPQYVGFQPGKTYYVRGKLREGSPVGVLKPGEIGNLNSNPEDPIELAPASENGGPWTDAFGAVEKNFPLQTIAELYRHPPAERAWAHWEMEVSRGFVSSKKDETGTKQRVFGILSGVDDSISADETMLKELQGGLGVFLPNHLIPLAKTLSPGSRVAILGTAKMQDVKDPTTKNPTGNKKPSFSAIAVKVVMDLGAGNGVTPDAGKVMVSLPTKGGESGPTSRDL